MVSIDCLAMVRWQRVECVVPHMPFEFASFPHCNTESCTRLHPWRRHDTKSVACAIYGIYSFDSGFVGLWNRHIRTETPRCREIAGLALRTLALPAVGGSAFWSGRGIFLLSDFCFIGDFQCRHGAWALCHAV